MTPEQFIAKWKRANLTESSAAQQHFLDLCDLLGQPKPAETDPEGDFYTFERGAKKTGGGDGWADVWKRGHFAWEYKGKRKDLDAAYQQLNEYREDLENPPLLVVCDLDRFQVHTNFTGTAKRVYEFSLVDLGLPTNLDVLRRLFTAPESLRPDVVTTRVTEEAARLFTKVAEDIRARGVPGPAAAHFLMKLIFCFFAEDIGLLPHGLLRSVMKGSGRDPARLTRRLKELFAVMGSGGDFGRDLIAYFDGGLFADAEAIDLLPDEIRDLIEVSEYAWEHVEPSIFGTLFERLLDPSKRSQIGAHYTSREDILTVVEPVLMAPLRREWSDAMARCEALAAEAPKAKSAATKSRKLAQRDRLLQDFVERLAHVKVLDPACGSGNFLYVAINLLLDLEKEVIAYAARLGLGLIPHVHPRQLAGVEINPYAQELASVVIWIGYLQWMHHHGFKMPDNPVLEPLDSIQRMDAIVDPTDPEHPTEPEWPEADVIVGNPPFLGGKQLRKNIGDEYVDAMFEVWKGRVPREADLCCYWFEKTRDLIRRGKVKRAGLLATQGIRGGANRGILDRIKESGDIFFAVSDRDWILDGANVHVSMIGFDDGSESRRLLDRHEVVAINANLTSSADLTVAARLAVNRGLAFQGPVKVGDFDIPQSVAESFVRSPNPTGKPNSDVVREWVRGEAINQRVNPVYIIDFGEMDLTEASLYEAPFEHVRTRVKAFREKSRDRQRKMFWWRLGRSGGDFRQAVSTLPRYVVTCQTGKHRLFAWAEAGTLPAQTVIAFARDDDYFFGVLQSSVHECWSRRLGTQLREAESGCRYTPTTCFETFPFPPGSGGIARDARAVQARVSRERVSIGARRLYELRKGWLNPSKPDGSPALSDSEVMQRSLTELYNQRPSWLELAHLELDRAVLTAYGWPDSWAESLQPRRDASGRVSPTAGVQDPHVEQEVLARLLALNREQRGSRK